MNTDFKCNCLDTSALGLRVLIAAIMFYYGIPKLINLGAGEFFGVPGFIGLLVGMVEVAAAVGILVGKWFKWSNNAVAAILTVAAIWIVGPQMGWLSPSMQRNLLVIAGNFLLVSTGPGSIALEE